MDYVLYCSLVTPTSREIHLHMLHSTVMGHLDWGLQDQKETNETSKHNTMTCWRFVLKGKSWLQETDNNKWLKHHKIHFSQYKWKRVYDYSMSVWRLYVFSPWGRFGILRWRVHRDGEVMDAHWEGKKKKKEWPGIMNPWVHTSLPFFSVL